MASEDSPFAFLPALAERAEAVFFAYDITEKRFTYLNPAFEKVWRKTRKSVLDNPAVLLKTIHPEDKAHVRTVCEELVEGTLVTEMEFRIKLRNHTERWICVKPIFQEEPAIIMGYAHEITQHKEYNNVLKKFSDKKNAVLNILSHDLAGPLGMIHNLAVMLEEDTKYQHDQEIHNMISLIERTSRQSIQLIQELVKQEFLESAGTEVIKVRVDLVGAIREFLAEYQQNQQITSKTFHYLPAVETLYLEMDDNKFMQVINNLISNALKFTPDGGEITVTVDEKEATALIKVADTGIGIPGKFHATLFDKFTRARRTGIKGEPSVGLGMSIIKTIVEWHQGHIWFQSEENKGTTFFIEIPKI